MAAPWLTEGLIAGEPGRFPPDTAQGRRPIRLNRNENAYGASDKVIAGMRDAVSSATRYPDFAREDLQSRIAGLHGVTTEQVVLGCGSGEILRMAVDAFLESKKKVVVAQPTFELIGQYARRLGTEVVAIPLNKDYSHDLNAMRARSDATTGLVYICNPNNPTGTLTRRSDLETIVRSLPPTTRVVVDEAYHHYVGKSADYASFLDRPLEDSRVIVVRTFSKIYGLAGLRIGYAICEPRTARLLALHQLSDDVNGVAVKAALAALDDVDHVRVSASRNVDDRQEFFNQANARMLRVIDSQTNFVMVNTGRPAVEIGEHFRKHDILIGPRFPAFDHYIRVSLGTPTDMREFWRVWDLMPGHKMSM